MKTAKLLTFVMGAVVSCMAQLAFAQAAVVQELSGTAQAIPNVGAPRTLRLGDSVNQGDTVATGVNSLLILRFPDEQVASLVGNSRMTIESYVYNPAEPGKGNIRLSLLDGGMRTVSGLIAKANPQQVTFLAADAAIGIRGTDIIIMVNDGNVVLQVIGGVATLIVEGMVRVVTPGQAGIKTKGGKVTGVDAAQLAQTLMMLFPNNAAIQTIAADIASNAAKINAANVASTGATIVNAQKAVSTTPGSSNSNPGLGGGSASGK